jgi:hypothetical protein
MPTSSWHCCTREEGFSAVTFRGLSARAILEEVLHLLAIGSVMKGVRHAKLVRYTIPYTGLSGLQTRAESRNSIAGIHLEVDTKITMRLNPRVSILGPWLELSNYSKLQWQMSD